MAERGRPKAKPAPEALLDRLGYYRRVLFQDNQRLMADALGVSQSYVSKIFTNAQPPSYAFLGSLARHPLVSRYWLLSGEGIPLLPSTAGTLPASKVILPGPPSEHADLLSAERYSVADNLERDTRYFLILQPASPLVRRFHERFLAGDKLLVETHRDHLDRVDVIAGRLCAVAVRSGAQSEAPVQCAMAQVFVKSGKATANLYDDSLPAVNSLPEVGRAMPKPVFNMLNPRPRRLLRPTAKQDPEQKKGKEDAPGRDVDQPGWWRLDGPPEVAGLSLRVVGLILRLERDPPLLP